MANDTSFETGFGGDATINGKTFPVVSWSGQFPATIVVFKNSKSGPHPLRASTYTDAMVTVVIDWNLTDQPFQSSQGALTAGTLITNVNLLISKNSNDGWGLSSMIVVDTPQSVVIEGKPATSLSLAMNGGTITPPNGSPY